MTPNVCVRSFQGLYAIDPIDLVAMKVIAFHMRANKPKGLMDRVDLERLLVALPELRTAPNTVAESLTRLGREDLISAWMQIANTPLEPDD